MQCSKAMREALKDWWYSRYSVINLAFRIALSNVQIRFKILDYGVEFSIELPYFLDKLNPICWFTKGLFCIALKLCAVPGDFKFSKTWYNLSKYKKLELEVMSVREILTLDYHWKVNCDHWGHWLIIAVAGLELSTNFYDRRHWDSDRNAPEIPE